ncbi:hypothetical protein BT96DRAFT_997692 [Gymnopus androsaceus JB14]|uniref:Uncharacterized protein n=1 Tax=Gymnopus androsaceus JB14 TaxID=1447944 RepID=A0A6A4HC31_9AGAR|nr:hypothetical protein BT96DRAFT_997692 [Gymnopus androsaceus JB14]
MAFLTVSSLRRFSPAQFTQHLVIYYLPLIMQLKFISLIIAGFAIAFASARPLPEIDDSVCNMLYFLVAADTYSLLEDIDATGSLLCLSLTEIAALNIAATDGDDDAVDTAGSVAVCNMLYCLLTTNILLFVPQTLLMLLWMMNRRRHPDYMMSSNDEGRRVNVSMCHFGDLKFGELGLG